MSEEKVTIEYECEATLEVTIQYRNSITVSKQQIIDYFHLDPEEDDWEDHLDDFIAEHSIIGEVEEDLEANIDYVGPYDVMIDSASLDSVETEVTSVEWEDANS